MWWVVAELVGRVVGERLRRVAVDVGVVHAEQVVLPREILVGAGDPVGDICAARIGSALPYCAQRSSASTARSPSVSHVSIDEEYR